MATQTQANKTFFDSFNMFKDMKIPSMDFEAAMKEHGKNLEALKKAQKAAFEAAKTMSESQMAFMKESMEDFKEHTHEMMGSKNLEEKVHSHTHRIKQSFDKAASHQRGLSEMISKTQEDISSTLSQRLQESMEGAKQWTKQASKKKEP
jgi:phasin family protein